MRMKRICDLATCRSLRYCLIACLLVMSALPLRAQTAPTAVEADTLRTHRLRLTHLALKTNLLFDAALAPNVEVELPLRDRRWSVMAECWFPWYVWHHNSRAYQLLYVGAEGRRWLGDRRRHDPLEGHFVGFFAGGGKYDFEWDSEGYQGEFYLMAGLSYGYAKRLNRRLRLEFNIGVGFLQTEYRHYVGVENDRFLVWQNDGRYTWLGPTKAKVSLVWLLPLQKGGAR